MNLTRIQVENFNPTRFSTAPRAKDDRPVVWHPGGIGKLLASWNHLPRNPPMGGNHIGCPMIACRRTDEGDLRYIRRPSRKKRPHWLESELYTFGSCYVAPPQRSSRK